MYDFDEVAQPQTAPLPTGPAGKPPKRRTHILRTSIAAGVLAVASAGVLVGHFTWPSDSTTAGGPQLNSSSGAKAAIPGRAGSGSLSPSTPRFALPGIGFPGTGNSGSASGSASSAAGAPSNTSSLASGIDAALVDINTNLSYESAEAAGTGMVLTSNGEILTNNHVIDGETSISVTDLGNGKTYSASVVGYDATKDIAVLQLKNASGLTTVPIGDSSSVKVGDGVVGVGNAEGAGGTPSYAGGSVTGVGQSITASDEGTGSSEQLADLIGTNANIEPGDSGGPLLNSSGQVIGIDTAGSSSSGGFGFQPSGTTSTQGYAIPIDNALSVAKLIVAGKSSTTVHIGTTAFLGVTVQAVNTPSPGSFGGAGGFGSPFGNSGVAGNSGSGTTTIAGVQIASAIAGAPAAKAGLSQGDIITSLGGAAVSTPQGLSKLMLSKRPGASVHLTYVDTSGTKHTTTLKLASGPPQ